MWYTGERRENCTRFWSESPKERDHLKDQGIGGRMGSDWISGRLAGKGGVEWIKLAQDGDWWWVLVNMVMNLLVLVPHSQLFREELSILSLF
jgi:hypothetical protein